MRIYRYYAFALFFTLSAQAFAKIEMSRIFSDGMVVQRDMPVKIWGKSLPNADIEVDFGGARKSTKADAEGRWSLFLDKMPADKKPRDLLVYENKKEGKRLRDVLVGEVWVLGGQSNMEWSVGRSSGYDGVKARANYPEIRYFGQNTWTMSKTPLEVGTTGFWERVSPQNVGKMSAVGFFFAEKLFKDLDVPVGLVFTAMGGARMLAFIPSDKVSSLEYARNTYGDFLERNAKYSYESALEAWKAKMKEWELAAQKARAENKKEPRKPQAPNRISYWPPTATPCYPYNAIIAPIAGFSARGVLWYQGESDSENGRLKYFSEQFELLASSWREKFGNQELYFLTVQLASFEINRDWALVRWKQYLCSKSVPKCFMVSIVDCGEKNDIHPKDKLTVGERLEKLALREAYGMKNIRPYGPVFRGVRYTPASAEVAFDMDGRKLVGKGSARGFELKLDGKWKPAAAELVGNNVRVFPLPEDSSAKIGGVRYLWKNWALPDVWLYNDETLPAILFINEK